jgi:hypothetical protein
MSKGSRASDCQVPCDVIGKTILTQTILFLVLSQRLKRLNPDPQWRIGNWGTNCDAHRQDPRARELGERDDGS